METAVQQFEERLDQLRSSLDDAETVDRLAACDLGEVVGGATDAILRPGLDRLNSNRLERHVYTYASCTILLYGLFEQYVESLIVGYVEELNRIVPSFSDLPETIQANHYEVSARLILHLSLDKYRGRATPQEISHRLSSCAKGAPFELNALGYTDHTANLRVGTINDLFGVVGLSGISKSVLKARAFAGYVDSKFPDGGVDGLRDEVVFEDLAVLVERRNAISHGWPDDTLAVEYMRQLCEFVRALGQAMHEVCRSSILEYMVQHQCKALPKPIAVYDGSIVCFRLEAGVLLQGMGVIARNGKGRLYEGEILELQVDHVSFERVAAPPAVDVGCSVGFTAKDTYDYFTIQPGAVAPESDADPSD